VLADNPVAMWVGAIIGGVSFVGTCAFLVWFMLDIQATAADLVDTASDIRQEQISIREELALQTASLTAIRQEQDQIEARQLWMVAEVTSSVQSLSIDMGRVLERTEDTK